MDWELVISTHWPHDRFALGFESYRAKSEEDYSSITLFFLIFTIDFNYVIQ